jgi:hypothetical protein
LKFPSLDIEDAVEDCEILGRSRFKRKLLVQPGDDVAKRRKRDDNRRLRAQKHSINDLAMAGSAAVVPLSSLV